MRIYNTLSRKIEEFKPINPPNVGLYTCGPTVYYYPQIGNWRTFVFEDILRRVLEANGYIVNHVMNVTDVGHLTGDNIGDADSGEDRMEKAAKREGKTAWDVAQFYIDDFIKSRDLLNIKAPNHFVRATDHITEQIRMIEKLLINGLAYVTSTGVFFDVMKDENYGQLGGQKLIDKRVATREELVDDNTKRNPADFALWKFSRPEDKRQMEWDSPWGKGFPGWHIECSAMSIKYLGETIDIHTGGIDHVAIHHTNEIAQSEGVTGKKFANFWMHGEFLTVDGGRMGKSLGNAYTLQDVVNKGFSPLDLRYFYLSAHYRTKLNFTWEALENAQNSLKKFRNRANNLGNGKSLKDEFLSAINDDLNMPQALAVAWQTENKDDMVEFDKVLGLDLFKLKINEIPDEIKKLQFERDEARKQKDFIRADEIRDKIKNMGYDVMDGKIS